MDEPIPLPIVSEPVGAARGWTIGGAKVLTLLCRIAAHARAGLHTEGPDSGQTVFVVANHDTGHNYEAEFDGEVIAQVPGAKHRVDYGVTQNQT